MFDFVVICLAIVGLIIICNINALRLFMELCGAIFAIALVAGIFWLNTIAGIIVGYFIVLLVSAYLSQRERL
jgi:threonine/homoserine efflux transporter RhtA